MKYIIKVRRAYILVSEEIDANSEEEAYKIFKNEESEIKKHRVEGSSSEEVISIAKVGCDDKPVLFVKSFYYTLDSNSPFQPRICIILSMASTLLHDKGLVGKCEELQHRIFGKERSIEEVFDILEEYVTITPKKCRDNWIAYDKNRTNKKT